MSYKSITIISIHIFLTQNYFSMIKQIFNQSKQFLGIFLIQKIPQLNTITCFSVITFSNINIKSTFSICKSAPLAQPRKSRQKQCSNQSNSRYKVENSRFRISQLFIDTINPFRQLINTVRNSQITIENQSQKQYSFNILYNVTIEIYFSSSEFSNSTKTQIISNMKKNVGRPLEISRALQ